MKYDYDRDKYWKIYLLMAFEESDRENLVVGFLCS
jgi:hypothetical protein